MNIKELKDRLKKLNGEADELEGKVASEKDEAKKKVLTDLFNGKVSDMETVAGEIEAFQAKTARQARVAKLAGEEEKPAIESKKGELTESEEDKAGGAKTVKVDASGIQAKRERDAASWGYLTAPGAEYRDVLAKVATEKPQLYDAISVTRGGKRMGTRPPSALASFIFAKMNGWTPESIREAMGGKADESVLTRNASGDNAGGGALVPDIFVPTLYRLPQLDARLMDRCMVKPAVNGTAYFPKLTQSTNRFGVTVRVSTEGNKKRKSTPVFTRDTVTTGEISALCPISHKELRVNNVGLEAELMWMFRGAFGEFVNKAILDGVTDSAFTGINTDTAIAAGVNEVAREAAGAISWADLVGLLYAIEAAAMGEATFISRSGATGGTAALAKLKDSEGRPLLQTNVIASLQAPAVVSTLLASGFLMTPDLAATLGLRGDVVCGAFRNYAVAVDQDITIDRSDEFGFDADMAWFRLMAYLGGKPLGYSCFSVLGDLAGVSSSSESSSSISASESSGQDDAG